MNGLAHHSPFIIAALEQKCLSNFDCLESDDFALAWLVFGVVTTVLLMINPSAGILSLIMPSALSCITDALRTPASLSEFVLLEALLVFTTLAFALSIFGHASICMSAIGQLWSSESVPRRQAEPGDVCAICLEELMSEPKKALLYCRSGCGKPTHKHCLQAWLKVKPCCPHCNVRM